MVLAANKEEGRMEKSADPRNGLTRRSILASSSAAVGGAALLASGLLPNGRALAAAPGDFKMPAYDALVRKKLEGKTLRCGFTPPILSEFFNIMEHACFQQAHAYSERFGIKWEWQRASPSGNFNSVEGQYNIIQNWIAAGLDAIFICTAGSPSDTAKIYEQAQAKGVTIIQFNMPVALWNADEMKCVTSVGYNDILQSGYVAGSYIAEKLNGKGKILQIWGPSGSPWADARQRGFDMVLAKYPDLKVVGKADGGYVRDKGFAAAQNLLTSNSDVNAIYGENEEMALGGSQAIDALGLKQWDGKSGIITIGADGLQSGFKAIREGRLSATISVGGVGQGLTMIEMLVASRLLKQIVAPTYYVPVTLVERDNVDEVDALQAWALSAANL
jgi:ribose transport system substrate-binding protein